MRRVRMFCDWDNDSRQLIERLKSFTYGFQGDTYVVPGTADSPILEFVDDDTYTHAVVFDLVGCDLLSPPENNVALLVEPPEIMDLFYPGYKDRDHSRVRKVYSFCDNDGFETRPGLGFATAPKILIGDYPKLEDKQHQVCMIVSDKRMTPYHLRRHEIKEAVLASDLDIHLYGRNLKGSDPRIRGEIPPMSKHTVISNYKFCIDFENTERNAVTDKFFDPIICNTVPVTNCRFAHNTDTNASVYINFDDPIDSIIDQLSQLFTTDKKFITHNMRQKITAGEFNIAYWLAHIL